MEPLEWYRVVVPLAVTVAPTPPAVDDRWRVEVLVDKQPRTVSSHLYLRPDPLGPDPVGDRDRPPGGCSLGAARPRPSPPGASSLAALGTLAALLTLRRASHGRAARRAVPV